MSSSRPSTGRHGLGSVSSRELTAVAEPNRCRRGVMRFAVGADLHLEQKLAADRFQGAAHDLLEIIVGDFVQHRRQQKRGVG